MKANVGDFVTATVDLPEPHPTRQGIYIGGNRILGETGTVYKVVEIHAVVTSLWGSTLQFVKNWRKDRAS
jgi:hypothetical protein